MQEQRSIVSSSSSSKGARSAAAFISSDGRVVVVASSSPVNEINFYKACCGKHVRAPQLLYAAAHLKHHEYPNCTAIVHLATLNTSSPTLTTALLGRCADLFALSSRAHDAASWGAAAAAAWSSSKLRTRGGGATRAGVRCSGASLPLGVLRGVVVGAGLAGVVKRERSIEFLRSPRARRGVPARSGVFGLCASRPGEMAMRIVLALIIEDVALTLLESRRHLGGRRLSARVNVHRVRRRAGVAPMRRALVMFVERAELCDACARAFTPHRLPQHAHAATAAAAALSSNAALGGVRALGVASLLAAAAAAAARTKDYRARLVSAAPLSFFARSLVHAAGCRRSFPTRSRERASISLPLAHESVS